MSARVPEGAGYEGAVALYEGLFGPSPHGMILTPNPGMFDEFGGGPIDPRWPFVGCVVHGPTRWGGSWIYATAGLSEPWMVDSDGAGLGVEYVMETPSPSAWAPQAMARIACYALLLAHGRFPGREGILLGDRIPAWDVPAGSTLTRLVAHVPERYPMLHAAPAGKVRLVHLSGITAEDHAFALGHGHDALVGRLREAGTLHLTDHGPAAG